MTGRTVGRGFRLWALSMDMAQTIALSAGLAIVYAGLGFLIGVLVVQWFMHVGYR